MPTSISTLPPGPPTSLSLTFPSFSSHKLKSLGKWFLRDFCPTHKLSQNFDSPYSIQIFLTYRKTLYHAPQTHFPLYLSTLSTISLYSPFDSSPSPNFISPYNDLMTLTHKHLLSTKKYHNHFPWRVLLKHSKSLTPRPPKVFGIQIIFLFNQAVFIQNPIER